MQYLKGSGRSRGCTASPPPPQASGALGKTFMQLKQTFEELPKMLHYAQRFVIFCDFFMTVFSKNWVSDPNLIRYRRRRKINSGPDL